MTMKIYTASAIAILAGRSEAFNCNSRRIDAASTSRRSPLTTSYIHRNAADLARRRSTSRSLHARRPNDADRADDEPVADSSRRAALRQCFSAALFASSSAGVWNSRPQEANAAGFAESIDEQYYYGPDSSTPSPAQDSAGSPQLSDSNVITPPSSSQVVQETASTDAMATSVPDSSSPRVPSATATVTSTKPTAPAVKAKPADFDGNEAGAIGSSDEGTQPKFKPKPTTQQVTLENSEVVTIPTKQVPVSSFSSTSAAVKSTVSPASPATPIGGIADLVLTGLSLGAAAFAVAGRIEPNTDGLSAKAKVVMIQPEPYGLDKGRKYFNGVDITINDPIPAIDIQEFCDAGIVNNDCTQTITGFLGEVQSNSQSGTEPSVSQQETAAAVLSYLNSLAGGGTSPSSKWSYASSSMATDATSERSQAFSSYLNGISSGEINAPSSAQEVANYLNSVNGECTKRLNAIEDRVNTLESSVSDLPDKIADRVQSVQMGQEERLAREFVKIEEYLVNAAYRDNCGINGELVNGGRSMSVNGEGINGESVNGDRSMPVNGEGQEGMKLNAVYYQ